MKDSRYTMKIPRELKDFFQDYITANPELGFATVSQFSLHILQEKAMELKKELDRTKE